MDDGDLELTVRSRGGERCDAWIRHHVIHLDQPTDVLDHDTGPTPLEIFVAGIAADVAQHASRYLHRVCLPGSVSVTARFRTGLRPARLSRIELEVAVADLPTGLRSSLLNVLERSPTYASLQAVPETSIILRPGDGVRNGNR
ncbi:hypothetical protein GCM10023085_32150 [Actinomadura viridis]|uniref:OsmC-like protein n=1 Tax=Actinomadura viridis TaxID=58110 RepID=A0A931GHH9_9ACTN|nr:OsmC family protein [Actinomadura viridis]MBG6086897.1 putative OsmC-like protein [Actinomadura viridis]